MFWVAFPAIAQADVLANTSHETPFHVAQIKTVEDDSGAVVDELAENVDLTFPEATSAEAVEPKTVKIDGSGLMQPINQALKQRFETEFPDTEVTLDANGTESAIQALLNEDIDLAAIGRSLTDEEKAQGLVEVPISQEPIAVIVGRKNPFDDTLTLEQFAQIFRGEITDWAEVGRSPGSIRLIDRPLNSDTRLVLARYGIVAPGEAATGEQVVRLETDDTAEIIRKLGTDGISYAIASQVEGQRKVKMVKLAVLLDTLPSSRFYPYSQIRGYAYKKASEAEVLSFVDFATGDAGQTAVLAAKSAEAKAIEKELNPPPIVSLVKQKTEKPTGAIAPVGFEPSRWVWLLVPLAVLFLILAWGRSQSSDGATPGAEVETDGKTQAKPNDTVTVSPSPQQLESTAPPVQTGVDPSTARAGLPPAEDVAVQDERPEIGAVPATSTEALAVEEKEPEASESASTSRFDSAAVDVADTEEPSTEEPGTDEDIPVEAGRPETENPEMEPLTLVSADGRVERIGSKVLYYWENADLIYRQGVGALEEGDTWVAIACFRRVVDLKPISDEAWLKLGQTQLDAGRVQDALQTYTRFITVKAAAPEAWLGKGACLERLGRGEEAQACYAESARLKAGAPPSQDLIVSPLIPGSVTEDRGAEAVPQEAMASISPTLPETASPSMPARPDLPLEEVMERRPPGEGTVIADAAMLDLVVLVNSQAPLQDEIHQCSQAMEGAIARVAGGRSVDAHVTWLGTHQALDNTPIAESAADYLYRIGKLSERITPSPSQLIALLAQQFNWRPGSAQSLFYIGNDKSDLGDPPAISSTLEAVKPTGTIVNAYLARATRSLSATDESSDVQLAKATGGLAFTEPNDAQHLQQMVEQVVEGGCRFCAYRRLTIHSQRDCYELDRRQMDQLQTTANSTVLKPGMYVIRIREGAFSYWSNNSQFDPEPWVMLWLYGGRFKNQQTKVEVGATWVVLNGYSDTLKLEVLEATTLCALFFDTYKDDNSGQITLSILDIND